LKIYHKREIDKGPEVPDLGEDLKAIPLMGEKLLVISLDMGLNGVQYPGGDQIVNPYLFFVCLDLEPFSINHAG